MGDMHSNNQYVRSEDLDVIEQNRLQALIEITEQHSKDVSQLASKIQIYELKSVKQNQKIKDADTQLKSLRVHNPDRMKKQIKRLQEQNRAMNVENTALKVKQKQLTQQLKDSSEELEKLREENEENEEKEKDINNSEAEIKSTDTPVTNN